MARWAGDNRFDGPLGRLASGANRLREGRMGLELRLGFTAGAGWVARGEGFSQRWHLWGGLAAPMFHRCRSRWVADSDLRGGSGLGEACFGGCGFAGRRGVGGG